MSKAKAPVAGEVLHGLTATGEYEVQQRGKHLVTFWEFTCVNGCKKMLRVNEVRRGRSTCGCLNRKRPEDRMYGFLRPTGKVESRLCAGNRKRVFWECECTRCGSVMFSAADNITTGHVKSCVCAKRVKGRVSTRVYPPVDHRRVAIRTLFSQYRKGASNRSYSWELTEDQFEVITSSNCHYCGVEPLQCKRYASRKLVIKDAYMFNGIDRQDNRRGYELSNCVPCCGVCNQTKMDLSLEAFLALITKIYKHSVLKETN